MTCVCGHEVLIVVPDLEVSPEQRDEIVDVEVAGCALAEVGYSWNGFPTCSEWLQLS